jgi:hypothetical protein
VTVYEHNVQVLSKNDNLQIVFAETPISEGTRVVPNEPYG